MTALLRAVRGATTVEHNDAEEITRHTQALVKEVMTRNEIVPDDLVSMIFTAIVVTAGMFASLYLLLS